MLSDRCRGPRDGRTGEVPVDRGQFEDWLERYKRVWEAGEPAAIRDLFTPDATYIDDPFGEPAAGLDAIEGYWQRIRNQRDVRFRHEVLAVTEDLGINQWWVSFTRATTGVHIDIEGIFAVRLDAGGRCPEFREWWHLRETPAAEAKSG